jgi:hypothetical protein
MGRLVKPQNYENGMPSLTGPQRALGYIHQGKVTLINIESRSYHGTEKALPRSPHGASALS